MLAAAITQETDRECYVSTAYWTLAREPLCGRPVAGYEWMRKLDIYAESIGQTSTLYYASRKAEICFFVVRFHNR